MSYRGLYFILLSYNKRYDTGYHIFYIICESCKKYTDPIPSKPNTELSYILFASSSLHPSSLTLLRLNFRPISKCQLSTLLCLHLIPIYLILSKGSSELHLRSILRYLISGGASRLDAFSVYPCRAWLPCHGVDPQQVHQRPVRPGPLVLRTAPLKYLTPAPDRDRTVSRRSEPSSRTALMGEQPNPWDLLQPQDAMSRHRGAKPLRRCELLGVISLLSPG